MPNHAPFLAVMDKPLKIVGRNQNPQKAHPGGEDASFNPKSVEGFQLGTMSRIKKYTVSKNCTFLFLQ